MSPSILSFVMAVGLVVEPASALSNASCSARECFAKDVALIQKRRPKVSQHVLQPEAHERGEPFPSSFAQKEGSAFITVVSYNLYWWNVGANNRWDSLYARIKKQQPFHLIGFQECENVVDVVAGSDLADKFDFYQGPNKPDNNPAPLAWDRTMFEAVAGPSHTWVASDMYGGRFTTWVRLRHKASGEHIFFANTHGPLGNCGSELGRNWVAAVQDNKQPEDTVFVTGDYNCGTGSSAMNLLKGSLEDDDINDIDTGIDQIITDLGKRVSGGRREGYPSDHPLVRGTFQVGGDVLVSKGDFYDWFGAPTVGDWGGKCRCPSGEVYDVGDNYDSCRSLACVGGEVVEACGDGVIASDRRGWKVICDGADLTKLFAPPAPAPAVQPSPAELAGADWYEWLGAPHVGAWGGRCKCPSGITYEVGDNYNSCGSIACVGGEVVEACAEGVISNVRGGWQVTCGGTSQELPSCDRFGNWPRVKADTTCDDCTALVHTDPYGGRCDVYCESFGHVCVRAAEEVDDDCDEKVAVSCETPITGTSDMLCTCLRASTDA